MTWQYEVKQSIKQVVKDSPLKAEALAARMAAETGHGLSWSQLYRWGDISQDDMIPLGRLVQLMLITSDTRPLDVLCDVCGGVFVRTRLAPTSMDKVVVKMLKETTDVLREATTAMQDGKITRCELAELRKEVMHAHEALAQLEATYAEENRKGERHEP